MIKTTINNNTIDKKVFAILLTSIVSSVFLYLFFIGVMSVSAAQMGGVEKEARVISANVSELEVEYMVLEGDITLEYAYSLGFKEPKKVAFATRKTFAINIPNEK